MKRKNIMIFATGILLGSLLMGCSFGKSPTSNEASKEVKSTVNESNTETNDVKNDIKSDDVEPSINDNLSDNATLEKLHPDIVDSELTCIGDDPKGMSWIDLLQLSCNEIKLSDDEEIKYPALNKALMEFSKKEATEVLAQKEDMLNDSLSMYKDSNHGADFLDKEFDNYSYDILRADSKVCSIRRNGESYKGGAHGYYYSSGACFDSRTGQRLRLEDIVKDKNKLAQVVYDNLMKEHKEQIDFDINVNNVIEHLKENELHIDYWTLGTNSLIIFFNPYEIASYAAGMLVVNIPFDTYKELFNEKYTDNINEFIFRVGADVIDINDDKKADDILVYPENDAQNEDPDRYNTIVVSINGKESKFPLECYIYSCESYVVKKADKIYLYVFAGSDNDYSSLYVYSLFGDKPNFVGILDNVYAGKESDYQYLEKGTKKLQGINVSTYESISTKKNLIDPNDFYMLSRIDCLGTYSANRRYKVGDNGMPVFMDKDYRIDLYENIFISNKAPISASEVDENGRVIAKDVIIPIGTQLLIYRTDDKFYCDLKTPEGKIMRVNIDNSVWPHKLNGKSEEVFFDMLPYAG